MDAPGAAVEQLSAGDLAGLGDGAVSVSTTATDTAGNLIIRTIGGFTLDSAVPTLSSAEANGKTLSLTFSEALNESQAPLAAGRAPVGRLNGKMRLRVDETAPGARTSGRQTKRVVVPP